MSETQMLTISGVLVATLFGLLTTVIGWGAQKVINKLDLLYQKLEDETRSISERINGIDRRVTRLETRCEEMK